MSAKSNRIISNCIASSALWSASMRRFFLRLAGVHLGGNVSILAGCIFRRPEKVSAGEGTFVGYRCTFEGEESIRIGKNCSIATGVVLLTTTHEIGSLSQRSGPYIHAPIEIGDGAWIGAGVTVLPGVTIGAGCIVGAGAVVTKSCEPNSLYVGTPAKKVRNLPEKVEHSITGSVTGRETLVTSA